MTNFHVVLIENCSNSDDAKAKALRQCVISVPYLRYKFHNIYGREDNQETFNRHIQKFVEDNNIRITKEKPIVYIGKDGRYIVDVFFTIDW